jgi:hypothetical protein
MAVRKRRHVFMTSRMPADLTSPAIPKFREALSFRYGP